MESSSGAENITLTENGSHTYSTTSSACLDFSFGVLQNTSEGKICELLEKAWKEDSTLTLKLIFQLRDIRNGKGALIEFHHCVRWLFQHHPNTLIHNLQFIAQHGYWKDLSWLVKFLLEGKAAVSSAKVKNIKNNYEDFPENHPVEELMRKRVNGEVDKQTWRNYLSELPDDEARKSARLKFQEIAKEIHKERSQKAKERKRNAKKDAELRLEELGRQNDQFARLYDTVVELFVDALQKDRDALDNGKDRQSDSIVAKWVPSVGGAIDKATSLGKAIARKLFLSRMGENSADGASAMDEEKFDDRAFAYYRKHYVTPLREKIKVPETFMSANNWTELDYRRVSSVCMKRNKKHFLKHDPDRFKAYLEDVKSGKEKIASGALMPHEIIGKFVKNCREASEIDEVCSLQWKGYVENLKKLGTFSSALSVCDVSGSMTGTPMNVAIALSLLTSEVSDPPFHGMICTFSEKPMLMNVNQETLREKVTFIQGMDWGSNTNFQAVFDCILELAKKTNLEPEKMVKKVFVFSDMEFDSACGRPYETDYQVITRKFKEAGYPVPNLIFWNLQGDNSKPVTKFESNVALVSGFSGQMLRIFLQNAEIQNPFQVMLASLGNRYDHLKVID